MRKRKRMLLKRSSPAECKPTDKHETNLHGVLKCTLVQTVLRNTKELELLLRLSSSDGHEIEKLFTQCLDLIDTENVQAIIQKTKKSSVCVKCEENTKTLQSQLQVGIHFLDTDALCSRCSETDLEKDSNVQPEDQRKRDSKQTKTRIENQNKDKNTNNVSAGLNLNEGEADLCNSLKRNCKGTNNVSRDDTEVQDAHVRQKRSQRLRSKRKQLDFVHSISTDEDQEEIDEKKSSKDCEPENKKYYKNQENEALNSKSSLICNVCGKKLLNRKTLKSHMTIHDDHQTYTCSICKRNFSHIRYLKKHERTHVTEKPFACEICGQRFKLKETLPKHMVLHGEVKPFQCEICQKQFHLESQMKKHILVHSDEKRFVCELCGKRFRTRGSMKSHMDTHKGPQKHSCDQCGKSYRSAWYLKVHLKTHTGENLIQCHSCGDWFIDPCYFKLHQRKFCKGNPLICSECGLEFPHNQALQSHMGLHTGERPHGCKVCGKGFAKATLLAEHMKRHRPDNCFTCQYCSKSFINKKELERHEKSHVKQKKKACLPDRLKPGHVDPKEMRTNDPSRKSMETGYLSQSVESDGPRAKSVVSTDLVQVAISQTSLSVPYSRSVSSQPGGMSDANNMDEVQYYAQGDCQNVVEATYYQSTSEPGNHVQIVQTPSSDVSSVPHFSGSTDKIGLMESAGAATQVLQGGHITCHEHIPHMYSQPAPSNRSLAASSYGHNMNHGSTTGSIIATESGVQLQQLQPIAAPAGLAGEVTVVYETETSVQHLLQAAAIIKDYPSQF